MSVNVELMERVLTQIKDHPELHDQGSWLSYNECGTAACFAGWACLLEGYRSVDKLVDAGDEATMVWSDGRMKSVRFVAMDLLGLDEDDAWLLFRASNTVEDLEAMVKLLANGERLEDHQEELD